MIELLIADSLAGAMQFAKSMGWEMARTDVFLRPPHGALVHHIREPEQMFGLRKAVLHVGPFAGTREAVAARRHLLNIAEARGVHIIPYALDDSPPEPLRFCLICGATTPCMWPEDLQPSEPGVPCTFDPTFPQIVQRLRTVEKENVQLRERLANQDTNLEQIESRLHQLQEQIDELRIQVKAYRRPGEGPTIVHRRAGS